MLKTYLLIKPVSITALSSVSALGTSSEEIWQNYLNPKSFLELKKIGKFNVPVSAVTNSAEKKLENLKSKNPKYKNLDKSVLLAILTSREAIKKAGWKGKENFGINIGSSRGATELFERYHSDFLQNKKLSTLASPTTTLGNISSWVAQDLQTLGPEISHSVTCSTALHALLNGISWIQSGMAEKFLVGGSEAALTPFTIAQIKAMKIYSAAKEEPFCEALNFQKEKNTMVVGEGAAMACLEPGISSKAISVIRGVGYATEKIDHGASISANAECFQKTMRDAMGELPKDEVDVIVMHAPGTIKGDLAEWNAIKTVFGEKHPLITSNKWKLGHTFGASGMLSLELGVFMLQHQQFVPTPFFQTEKRIDKIQNILINAVGFGGNAVSILLSRH
ncbi:MAG TPA: beta-ketoacyl synthase N-terminal-like domain-containing protein [Salinimicrobium sp.]|nr:beta-ketoacyl synthase N-terminal-like domain-containing protein [Salinimicrobium sp.]